MNLQPAMVPATLMLEALRPFSYRHLHGEYRSSCERNGSLLAITVPSPPGLLMFLDHHSAVDRESVETLGTYCFSPLVAANPGGWVQAASQCNKITEDRRAPYNALEHPPSPPDPTELLKALLSITALSNTMPSPPSRTDDLWILN